MTNVRVAKHTPCEGLLWSLRVPATRRVPLGDILSARATSQLDCRPLLTWKLDSRSRFVSIDRGRSTPSTSICAGDGSTVTGPLVANRPKLAVGEIGTRPFRVSRAEEVQRPAEEPSPRSAAVSFK